MEWERKRESPVRVTPYPRFPNKPQHRPTSTRAKHSPTHWSSVDHSCYVNCPIQTASDPPRSLAYGNDKAAPGRGQAPGGKFVSRFTGESQDLHPTLNGIRTSLWVAVENRTTLCSMVMTEMMTKIRRVPVPPAAEKHRCPSTGRAQTLRHRTRRKQWRVGRLESCGTFVCLFVCVFGRLFNCFCIDIAICIFVCMDLYLFETMFVWIFVSICGCLYLCTYLCLSVSLFISTSVCLPLLVCKYLCLFVWIFVNAFLCVRVCWQN